MKKLVIISSLLFLIMQMNCIKKDFTPQVTHVNDEQYLKLVNTKIAELRTWLPAGSTVYKIPDEANWVIQGVVVSSDVNGNFYKCIHIQDSTAGIQLMIDGSGLYASYPVGMRVFVKLAGLGLTTYNNQLELGLFDNTTQKVINIPTKLLGNYIVKGSLNNGVDTLKLSDVTTLSSIYQSRLVKLSNVMIDTTDKAKKTMGDIVSQSNSYFIDIQDARKNTLRLVTSPYATFANQPLPKGAGYIVGVLTQYNDYMQLSVNGMSDIYFNPDDTLNLNTTIPNNWKIKKISEVRSWKGNISRLPMVGDTAIRGIVVSDNSFVNMPDSQLFIQDPEDNNSAICIFLNKKATDIKFKQGDEIVVNLKGAVLTSQNAGKVIASFVANHGANVKDPTIVIMDTHKPVDPVSVSLDALITDLATENPIHEAQLIKVENGYFGSRQGQTFSGNIYLGQKDYTAQLTCYTKTGYTGGNLVPDGLCNVSALVAKYSGGYEFIFRMPTDVEDLHLPPPTTVNPDGCTLYEDFEIRTGGSFAGTNVALNSGQWFIAGFASMQTGDRFEGGKSIRLRGSTTANATDADKVLGYNTIQMNFDKADGIGSVKFKYGSFSTHSGGVIFVEYSTDGGTNWTKATPSITVPPFTTMLDADILVNISSPVRIRIIKYTQSGSTSVNIDNICIGDYGATPITATPTFTPTPDTYSSAQDVAIACSTPTAEIYYSLDGNAPNIGSPNTFLYATPIPVTATTTIRAFAVKSGMTNSNMATAVYTINIPTVFLEDFEKGSKVAYAAGDVTCTMGSWHMSNVNLATSASDQKADLKSTRFQTATYDTLMMNFDKSNGVSTITLKHGLFSGDANTKFVLEVSNDGGATWAYKSDEITVTSAFVDETFNVYLNGNIRIRITKPTNSAGRINIDNIKILDYTPPPPTAIMPTFSPLAGTIVAATQSITINTLTPGAIIYYTLNGSNPAVGTLGTMEYSTPITLNAGTTTTIKAIAVDGSGSLANSNVASATYIIQAPGVVQTPTFDGGAGGGTFTTSKSVVIACTTAGATIWYTTNGDDPSNASGSRQSITSGSSISIAQNTTLRAIAEASGMTASSEVSADYKIRFATPTISSDNGTNVTLPTTITVTITASGADKIYYTTDGTTTPTASSTEYTVPIVLNTAGVSKIQAIAVKAGMENSNPTAITTYTINPVGGGGSTQSIWNYTSANSDTATVSLKSNGGTVLGTLKLSSGKFTNSTATTGSPSIYSGNWQTSSLYWLFTFTNVTITTEFSWDYYTYGTGTSPRDWDVSYSTDSTSWTSCTTYSLTNSADSSFAGSHINGTKSMTNGTYPKFFIKLIPTSTTSLRGATVASGGNSRLVTGIASSKGSPIKFTFN